MAYLSRPTPSQFKFHEEIEHICISADLENNTLILDPTSESIKLIKVLHPISNLNLKIADIDILKYKLSTSKFMQLKIIIESVYDNINIHIDDTIALNNSLSHDFTIFRNIELAFIFFSYNNGNHWNGTITNVYDTVEVNYTEVNNSIDIDDNNYIYTFGTDRVRPLPGAADSTSSINAAYGMTQTQANTYYSSTNLNGLVTIIGNGFQQFKIPNHILNLPDHQIDGYDIELTVQGANGGNNIAANNSDKSYVGYGGRGAILKGIYRNIKPGQILYLLVGQVGWCNAYADYGGGGGGASVVFIPDVDFINTMIFEPTSEIVKPLIIAGGGAGRYDNGYTTTYNVAGGDYDIANESASINAKFENGNFTTAMTAYGSTYSSVGGGSLGIAYGYHAAAYGRSPTSIALLNTPNTAAIQRPGGFGGGGSPYNWGGGGGGLNGGDGNETNTLLSGGTSWIDSSIEEISRSLVPLDQIIGQRPPQGQIILKIIKLHYHTYE